MTWTQWHESLHTVDGSTIRFASMPFPTRMTVVRLPDGGLWVHSPVALTDAIADAIDAHGPVRHLVAPNDFHHLYVADWRARWPEAQTWAVPGLVRKRPDIRWDHRIEDSAVDAWGDGLRHAVFRGSRLMDEAVFFHVPSRSAILTDLVVNLDLDGASWFARAFGRFDQVRAPDGGTPRLFRWSMRDRTPARVAIRQLLAWAPERLLFAHGLPVQQDATAWIEQRFAWLLGTRAG